MTSTEILKKEINDWLDKCPSNSVEIIADEDNYWDIRVKTVFLEDL